MITSLSVLIFNLGVQPFDSKYETFIEVFNESNVLLISYFALQIIYTSGQPLVQQIVGRF